jgi:hypothetical protein
MVASGSFPDAITAIVWGANQYEIGIKTIKKVRDAAQITLASIRDAAQKA